MRKEPPFHCALSPLLLSQDFVLLTTPDNFFLYQTVPITTHVSPNFHLIILSNIKEKEREGGQGAIGSVMVIVCVGNITHSFSCIYRNKGNVAALLHIQKFFIHDYI